MNIIIAGDGKVGSTLTRQLVAEGHDITLIDAKAEVLEVSEERYDVMAVQETVHPLTPCPGQVWWRRMFCSS